MIATKDVKAKDAKDAKDAKEQIKFWRESSLQQMEMLRATYVTHSFSRHTHEGYAIGIIESGVEEFNYQGATHRACPGDIVIINPGEVHTGHAGVPEGWTYRMIYPEVSLMQQACAELRQENLSEHHLPFFPQAILHDRNLMQQFRLFHQTTEAAESVLERESRCLWTLAQLIDRHADFRPIATPIGQEHRALCPIRDYLETHYAEPITLDQLATIACLKPLRLLRVFQRQFGLPPHAYLIQVRVRQAKLLLATGHSIADVAFATGFTDQSHLNRHFKRLVGVTPRQYRIPNR